jgi:hypothetical protein
MERDIIISGKDVKLLQFLIINAQCHFDKKREYTQLDKDVMRFAGDILSEIATIRKKQK